MDEISLKYFDRVMASSTEDIINSMKPDLRIAEESFIPDVLDDDYTDMEDLIAAESIGSSIKNTINNFRDRKRAEKEKLAQIEKETEEKEKLKTEKERLKDTVKQKLSKYEREFTDANAKSRSYKKGSEEYANLITAIGKLQNAYFSIVRKVANYNDSLSDFNKFKSELIAEISDSKSETISNLDELVNELRQKLTLVERTGRDNNPPVGPDSINPIGRMTPSVAQQPAKSSSAIEAFTADDLLLTIAGGSIGFYLFKNIIAHKEASSKYTKESRPYYYILSNEFKKSERSLKLLLKTRKNFITSKVVLSEIVDFKKKYYNRVAMCVNRFMEAYESIKPIIGKEKDYMFETNNPVRDRAIVQKLSVISAKFYEMKHSKFMDAVIDVLEYEPEYIKSSNTQKILVDNRYLDELLNPTETFRIIDEIEGIINKIPAIDSANHYQELLMSKQGNNDHMRMYVSIMCDLRDTANKVRGVINAYINIVFAILDFTVIANNKTKPSDMANESYTEATEGLGAIWLSIIEGDSLSDIVNAVQGYKNEKAIKNLSKDLYSPDTMTDDKISSNSVSLKGKYVYKSIIDGKFDEAKAGYKRFRNATQANNYIVNSAAYAFSKKYGKLYEDNFRSIISDLMKMEDIIEKITKSASKLKMSKTASEEVVDVFEKLTFAESQLKTISEEDYTKITDEVRFDTTDSSEEVPKAVLDKWIDLDNIVAQLRKIDKIYRKCPDPKSIRFLLTANKKQEIIHEFDDRILQMTGKDSYVKLIYRYRDYVSKVYKEALRIALFKLIMLCYAK